MKRSSEDFAEQDWKHVLVNKSSEMVRLESGGAPPHSPEEGDFRKEKGAGHPTFSLTVFQVLPHVANRLAFASSKTRENMFYQCFALRSQRRGTSHSFASRSPWRQSRMYSACNPL
jgi:hypothetical protein